MVKSLKSEIYIEDFQNGGSTEDEVKSFKQAGHKYFKRWWLHLTLVNWACARQIVEL